MLRFNEYIVKEETAGKVPIMEYIKKKGPFMGLRQVHVARQ